MPTFIATAGLWLCILCPVVLLLYYPMLRDLYTQTDPLCRCNWQRKDTQMTPDQLQDITHRLDIYMDIPKDEAREIVSHVEQALGISPETPASLMTDAEVEAKQEKSYREGYKDGYRIAIEDVRANDFINSDNEHDAELNKLQSDLLDAD